MDINKAMLQVAKKYAERYGYEKVEESTLDASKSWFWGNKALAEESKEPIRVNSVLYAKEGPDGDCRIDVDMHWGKPRLNVRLTNGDSAHIVYRDGVINDVQAFGEGGLELALGIKDMLDKLLKE